MRLFLDFDGTTHPVGAQLDQEFCCLPRLESVLRDFPEVQVVISSWWRADQDLETLQSYFSEDLRSRVIDVTPFTDKIDEHGFVLAIARQSEILKWIAINDYSGPWVALDDATEQFSECPQLIACKSWLGIDEEIENQLRAYLQRHS